MKTAGLHDINVITGEENQEHIPELGKLSKNLEDDGFRTNHQQA